MIECPLCNRLMPEEFMERHHLDTKKKDKQHVEKICKDCHDMIHSLFKNQELRNDKLDLNSLEGILSNEKFLKALTFIRKIKPGSSIKIKESRHKKR